MISPTPTVRLRQQIAVIMVVAGYRSRPLCRLDQDMFTHQFLHLAQPLVG